MFGTSSTTPLIALDAVVIDTETTGLDPSRAWAVELAGVKIAGGRLSDGSFRRLIKPGEPIPSASTRIHGLDDDAVAEAPDFAAIWPEFCAYTGDAIVIGHAVGFDLAVMRRECERAGLPWKRPRCLDTRLLAEIAEPNLAGYTLESLAAWLDVEITDRHSARGDALACARVFLALLPRLREGGIRTLAEAERACRALTEVLDEHHRAGWVEPVEAPARNDAERTLRRIDSYAYRHRVRDIMRSPPEYVAGSVSVRDALARLMRLKISSLYVDSGGGDAHAAADTGIVTERDLLRALAEGGEMAFSKPVTAYMSKPLATVPADAFVYRAIGRMSRLKVRHLGVADDAGIVVGALSARDLLKLRAGEAISLGDEIEEAEDAAALARAWAKLPHVTAALLEEGLSGRDIAAVVSRELGALTRQAAALAEQRMRAAGRGEPPCGFAVAVLGSAGRGESLLAMDQDNALFFAEGEPGGANDRWFEAYGVHLADILHEAGIPYCKGGVMAKNAPWRGSLATWRERIAHWISRSDPEDLLAVDIFFDLRGVYGDGTLTQELWRDAFASAKGQVGFAKLLAASAGSFESGLGLFGAFKSDQGRLDLKRSGTFAIVTVARTLAVCHHVTERGTVARLAGLKALDIGGDRDLDALQEAHAVFVDYILAQQVDDLHHGIAPSNAVQLRRLDKRERDRLRVALKAVEPVEQLMRDLLFAG
jgi:DNA polymerase-3 subunit epsilon/CBS domain-containing protein